MLFLAKFVLKLSYHKYPVNQIPTNTLSLLLCTYTGQVLVLRRAETPCVLKRKQSVVAWSRDAGFEALDYYRRRQYALVGRKTGITLFGYRFNSKFKVLSLYCVRSGVDALTTCPTKKV